MQNRKMWFPVRLLALVAPIVFATRVLAQQRVTAAADLGFESGNGQGGYYDNRDLKGFRLAASVRLARNHVGFFVEASKESLGSLMGRKAVCRLGTDGKCVPWYPELHGWSSAGGVFVRSGRSIEARLGIGPARYATTGQPAVASAVVALADLAVYPASHVGLAVVMQHIALSSYQGERLSVRPITVAIRVR